MWKKVAAVALYAQIALSATDLMAEQISTQITARQANAQAEELWLSGCSDFKNGLNEGDFPKWLRLQDRIESSPMVKRSAVVILYMDGWNTARGQKGVINCGEFAPLRAGAYTSGIDIRQGA